ncbi:GGDEF domain-containing protein [Limibacillus halophilus]|uniref:diguanylate cyclase n=1 Tax=Limibacillus halophilus TaxID=1579333 RepID=A0A839SX46_9PROT|nr:diguanylate cyclase [Limibacillus halophilus]MBB3066878.1 diguanylate cyclase (GGDEF)-like protein [Limibacillus halophilus]
MISATSISADDSKPLRIALVDDDIEDKVLVESTLRSIADFEYELIWISDTERADLLLLRAAPDVCLLDYWLGGSTGLDVMERLKIKELDFPVLLLTGTHDRAVDLEAMNRGVFDYLVKGEITPALLERSIRYALHRHQLEQQVRDLSLRDPLTGLSNRRFFEEALVYAARRSARRDRSFHVIVIDVDQFKQINDKHGHAAGDKVLIEVGERLRRQVRATDVVARIGGDEFAVILEEGEQHLNLTEALDRMRNEMQFSLTLSDGGQPLAINVSIGLASSLQAEESPSGVVARADRAMYEAKRLRKIAS